MKRIAVILAALVGVVLILAAVAEFAVEPILALLGRPVQHEHRPAWMTITFLLVGILLAFPSAAGTLYRWAKPYIPNVSIRRGGS